MLICRVELQQRHEERQPSDTEQPSSRREVNDVQYENESERRLKYCAFTRSTSSLLLGAQQGESRSLLKDLSNTLSRLGGAFQISSRSNLLRNSFSLSSYSLVSNCTRQKRA